MEREYFKRRKAVKGNSIKQPQRFWDLKNKMPKNGKRKCKYHEMRNCNWYEMSLSLDVELLFRAQVESRLNWISKKSRKLSFPLLLQLGVKSFLILTQLSENYIVRELLQTFDLIKRLLWLLWISCSFMFLANTFICKYKDDNLSVNIS